MKFKLAGWATAFFGFSILVGLSVTPAEAGMWRYKASQGKVMNYVGCGKFDRISRIMAKHPERYGQAPASPAASNKTRGSVVASK